MFRAISILLAFVLVGCAPRGETKSLDEILATAKARFAAVKSEGGEHQANVTEVVSKMESILSNPSFPPNGSLHDIGVALGELGAHAGYTSRPAMNEISLQYVNLSSQPKIAPEQMKLLASRTYSLLASELETNRFRF